MNRTKHPTRLVVVATLALGLIVTTLTGVQAAPPLIEGARNFRIVDASGRIAPRTDFGPSDRVALRPSHAPPPLLLRSKLLYLSGYPGATYGPALPPNPTSRRIGHGFFRHGK